jgi:hypothetical protein
VIGVKIIIGVISVTFRTKMNPKTNRRFILNKYRHAGIAVRVDLFFL